MVYERNSSSIVMLSGMTEDEEVRGMWVEQWVELDTLSCVGGVLQVLAHQRDRAVWGV